MMNGKKVIIAITGSIAAYKIATLVRLLKKQEAEVKVIMSEKATKFITPLTLATLSKNPVLVDFEQDKTGIWNNHVELGLWADLILLAPASANTLAKCANGFCDNLLTAVYLSAKCPVIFAPAMDLDMYKHPSVQNNLKILQNFGNLIIPSEHGELASGLVGEGRMAEPENIVVFLEAFFQKNQRLKGKKVLITAGPTHEAIDPVRFIGNHSSGKMGYALAEEASNLGADVILVSGPSKEVVNHSQILLEKVTSAQQMYEVSSQYFREADIIILAAAVADYKPQIQATHKIKKKTDSLTLILDKTIDIAQTLGQIKKDNQFMVGFALETQNELENAKGKLLRKNMDMIVLNSLQEKGAGFKHDTNKITIIDKAEKIKNFELKSKKEVAKDILTEILERKI